jgi:hypothetical protein
MWKSRVRHYYFLKREEMEKNIKAIVEKETEFGV